MLSVPSEQDGDGELWEAPLAAAGCGGESADGEQLAFGQPFEGVEIPSQLRPPGVQEGIGAPPSLVYSCLSDSASAPPFRCIDSERSTDGDSSDLQDSDWWTPDSDTASDRPWDGDVTDVVTELAAVQGVSGVATVDLGVLASCDALPMPTTTPTAVKMSVNAVGTIAPGDGDQPVRRKRDRETVRVRGIHESDEGTGTCPFCLAEVKNSCEAPEQDARSPPARQPGRFARYAPRTNARKSYRLTLYYCKFGYQGPRYCRACAESFNSHLLRQAVRSQRAACTRSDPCEQCTMILRHFDTPKEELFEEVDAARCRKKTKCSRPVPPRTHARPGPRAGRVADEKASPLMRGDCKSPDMGTSLHRPVQLAIAAASIVFVSIMALLSFRRNPTAIRSSDEMEWDCGPTAIRKTNHSYSYLASFCEGRPLKTTFPCGLDDCADGEVAVGYRACRCDGCVQSRGRCARWKLEGYGPLTRDSGCKTIDADAHPYIWNVPGQVTTTQCDGLCGDMQGCYNSLHLGDHCDLHFPRAWPQPLVQDSGVEDIIGTLRSGGIWTTDGRVGGKSDIWHFTSDDGGILGSQTNVIFSHHADGTAGSVLRPDAKPNLQLMWRYDSFTQRWTAIPSSLTNRPSPRVGAGRWSDGTGSLYMLGGLSTQSPVTVRGTVPFSASDPNYDGSVAAASESAELWRYVTDSATWEPLHPSAAIPAHSVAWPSGRTGAAVWRDRGPLSGVQNQADSDDGLSLDSRVNVWMFGGGTELFGITSETNLRIDQRISSELWRYTYSPGNHSRGSGNWALVAAQAGEVDDAKPLYTCGSIERADCPTGRKHAASWPSPNGLPGKTFATCPRVVFVFNDCFLVTAHVCGRQVGGCSGESHQF